LLPQDETFPVLPESPPGPDVAEEFALGFEVALPVLPECPIAVALESPVSPDVASPCAFALASPVSPDFVTELASPVSPDSALASALPVGAIASAIAGPEFPDEVCELAFESPEVAFACGFAVASPELPVVPDVAVGLAVESPEVAVPLELAPDEASPELPPSPE
jgi:hypothetical protein